MSSCMHVLMHACPHACMSSCMHVLMHACPHACMSSCMHVLMHACPHACMSSCMHVLMHACPHACMASCMHGLMHACPHACMSSCMHVLMHACHHACMSSCMHVLMHACPHVCMSSCMPHVLGRRQHLGFVTYFDSQTVTSFLLVDTSNSLSNNISPFPTNEQLVSLYLYRTLQCLVLPILLVLSPVLQRHGWKPWMKKRKISKFRFLNLDF